MIIIDRCRHTLLGTEAVARAKSYESATFGSFVGDRTFSLAPGQYSVVKLKGKHWRDGDQLTLAQLVQAARGWTDIPWRWT